MMLAFKGIKSLNMKKISLVVLFWSLCFIGTSLLSTGCDKNSNTNYVSGTLRDYTGLDGCNWIIVLEDSSKLEPVNLASFDLELRDGLKLQFSYHERTDLTSICMVGRMAEIDAIKTVTSANCDQSVLIDEDAYENAPDDAFTLNAMSISGDCLSLNFTASGCDGSNWIVKLIDSDAIAESYPCQRYLRLSLENNEVCDALPTVELSFDISSLQIEGDEQVILHVSGQDILYTYERLEE